MTPTGAQPGAAAADASDEHPPRKVRNPMTTPTMSGHTAPQNDEKPTPAMKLSRRVR